MAERCRHKMIDGARCRAYATKTSEFCYAHDPAVAEKRLQERSIGGKLSHRYDNARRKVNIQFKDGSIVVPRDAFEQEKTIHISSTDDLKDLLERTLDLAFNGQANAQLLNAITHAINAGRQLLETAELEKRIAELERQKSLT